MLSLMAFVPLFACEIRSGPETNAVFFFFKALKSIDYFKKNHLSVFKHNFVSELGLTALTTAGLNAHAHNVRPDKGRILHQYILYNAH